MIMKEIRYVPIGIIYSPFKDIKGMPIQPTGARGIAGTIEIDSEYVNGLKDIEACLRHYLSKKSSQTLTPNRSNG
jgi:tRNA (Thr-GGU) A37 N-methylase